MRRPGRPSSSPAPNSTTIASARSGNGSGGRWDPLARTHDGFEGKRRGGPVYLGRMTPPAPSLRDTNLDKLAALRFDVLVLGGGINGAVSAAALATRGAKVALIDRGDFASVTSQQSSNLAWGGIKYLETYEFGLVRKLCRARNRLLRAYPSTVQEIRFFTSVARGFRHNRLKLWLGALLYWAIGAFFTDRPRLLSARDIAFEEPIVETSGLAGGFEDSDAYLYDNDARFVWGFVRSALDHGCVAANYVEALGSARTKEGWVTRAREATTGRELSITSSLLINACGPYADEVNARDGISTAHRHVFSKGIHIIVDRLTPRRRVLTFFADGRLFFVIPMAGKTCIGTTDTRVERPEVEVTPEDREFVLENINKRLRLPRPLTDSDIIAERCGVRPLVVSGSANGGRDWMQLSRKHAVDTDAPRGRITVFGGKLSDCLNVGEEICAEVRRLGVDLPQPKRARYGAEALGLLEAVRRDPRQAEVIIETSEYIRCELDEAARREMVVKLEDFLRRRSKIALVVRQEEIRAAPGLREACRILFGDEQVDAKIAEYFGSAAAPAWRQAAAGVV